MANGNASRHALADFGADVLYGWYHAPSSDTSDMKVFKAEAEDGPERLASLAGLKKVDEHSTWEEIRDQLTSSLDDRLELRNTLQSEFGYRKLIILLADKLMGDRGQDVQDPTVLRLGKFIGTLKEFSKGDQARIVKAILYFCRDQALQIALAFKEALPFPLAFQQEFHAVLHSRYLRDVTPTRARDAREAQLLGLAFSGGGIRSATFNLGILQALAELKLLHYFDYLSTVSGGGYIGSWLHAWIHRKQSTTEVAQSLSPKETPDPESEAARPIKWLRSCSNYLAPRLGMFSADTWSIFTTWARNTLLNLAVLVLSLSAGLLFPRVLHAVFIHFSLGMLFFLGSLVFSVFVIQQNLREFADGAERQDRAWFWNKWIHLSVALPVFVSAVVFAAGLSRLWVHPYELCILVSVFFFVLLCIVAFGGGYRTPRTRSFLLFSAASIFFNGVAAVAGGLLLFAAGSLLARTNTWHQLIWGPPAMVTLFSLVIILHLGLFGRNLSDDRREWWSRLGAVLSIWVISWVLVAVIAVDGPFAVAWLIHMAYGKLIASGAGICWLATTIMGVLKARSKETGPPGRSSLNDLLSRLAPPVFVVGLLLLLSFAVHLVGLQLIGGNFGSKQADAAQTVTEYKMSSTESSQGAQFRYDASFGAPHTVSLNCAGGCGIPESTQLEAFHYELLNALAPGLAGIGILICLSAALLLAWRVDINEFSMHSFYKNRLVRAYMGASRPKRRPNRFTGFDPEDELDLDALKPSDPEEKTGYAGPFPIINTALNLVGGEELAWQERKAESFFFTPLFSGFSATPTDEADGDRKLPKNLCLHAFRRTQEYAFPDRGIQVGNAVAISGAAVCPNMGYHSSASVAFLLTVFNVRLGRWIGNPRHRKGWTKSGPRVGLAYLLAELAGSTNNKSKYVYLSDGGHFENLGIYELVRRKCAFIVACDAGADPGFAFEDLGNAIRKCRSDFGTEVDIDLGSLRPAPAVSPFARSWNSTHCATGSIAYPDGARGVLVYIKASLSGDEPSDVLEYANLHPEFPHQPTSDQFFNESQFESYRQLGYHVGTSVLGETVHRREEAARNIRSSGADRMDCDRAGFFSDMRQRWQAPSARIATLFTRHAEVLTKLMEQLRTDSKLSFLDTQISPEWQRLVSGAANAPASMSLGLPEKYEERRAGFYFCNSLMQLMEDVYLDLNLEQEYKHPDNAGWMNLFKHWSWSAMFRATWMISASCYGSRFRGFCEHQLDLGPDSIGEIRITPTNNPQDPRLNFRERDLLANGQFNWHEQKLYLLELFIKRPDSPRDIITQLTVGIAVVSKNHKLAYFRVQDHLRRMGLARRIIQKIVLDGSPAVDRTPKWQDLPPGFPEMPAPESKERIERMLDAAFIRKDSRRR